MKGLKIACTKIFSIRYPNKKRLSRLLRQPHFFSVSDIFVNYPDAAGAIYGFNLDVVKSNPQQESAAEKIGNTVVFIVEIFLIQNTNAFVYLCDTADKKQSLCKRKFDIWFKKIDDGNILKIDRWTKAKGSVIFNTLFISKDNPLTERIESVFDSLNENLKDKAAEQ